MKIKTKSKVYITLGVFLATYLVVYIFLIYPAYSNIKKESQDLISQKNNILSNQDRLEKLKDFNKNKSNYKENFVKADKMLVDTNNLVPFIEFLEKTARESGVQLNISLAQGSESKALSGEWQLVYFQLASFGGFSNHLNFAEKMENAPYLISIQNMKISRKEKNIETDYYIKVFGK